MRIENSYQYVSYLVILSLAVILSEAKDLIALREILHFVQNDKLFC